MAIDGMKANRALDGATKGLSENLNKAASGKRINKASDDAAGLAIAMSLQSDSVVLEQGTRNAYDAQSAINIAQGAYNSLGEISTRQAELAAQAANGVYSDEQRANLNNEAQALAQEAQRIQATTEFNGQNVMSASMQAQVGTDSSANSQITVSNSTPAAAAIDLTTAQGARNALDSTNSYIAASSQAQGNMGAVYSRLEIAANNNKIAAENLTAARSRIEDADMGETSSNIKKYGTQQQIGASVLQQTTQQESIKLNLLKKA